MLTEVGTPKRTVAQASLKSGPCHGGCGRSIQYRTNPRICCDECKLERKRASARIAMEKQRRKRGVPKIKGTVISCQACGVQVALTRSARARFCPSCYRINNDADAARRSLKRRSTESGRLALNKWQRDRRRNDPSWRVSAHVRTLMHRGIGKRKAGRSWKSFVPYTLEDLMRHLERQFLPGMTWENQGDWHIDHIVPLRCFTFTGPDDPDFKAAWALTNLRPLWSLDNIRKNGRRTLLI